MRPVVTLSSVGVVVFTATATSVLAGRNTPPAAPTITEPAFEGIVVNPADVHMECEPFSDPNGDDHLCTDWEIWTVNPLQRVWYTSCIDGVERVHSHLGDGVFENSHAGLSELMFDTQYFMRTRHADDSGDKATQWSAWSQVGFVTGSQAAIYPMVVTQIIDPPAPVWIDAQSEDDVVLPAGATPPKLTVENGKGALLLEIAGFDGFENAITTGPQLKKHEAIRIHIEAGQTGSNLVLDQTNLTFTDHCCEQFTVLLPAVNIPQNEDAYFWVDADGQTYEGQAFQMQPNFDTLLRGPEVPWATRQSGYAVDVFATGFALPVAIAFVPDPGEAPDDPLFYVAELYGSIKVVTNDGTVSTYASNLLNYSPSGNFPGSGEQGLGGLVVDPTNGDIYAGMLYAWLEGNPAVRFPKIVRFTSSDGGMTADTETDILDLDPYAQGQSHFISNMTFGPDDKLYVHMGDGFEAAAAMILNDFRGKILRMERDGSPADDNPFYDVKDGIDGADYVYALGFRNPFGGAWRTSDNMHYQVENGPQADRLSRVEPGVNYGFDGTNESMSINAIHNWMPATAPVGIAFVQTSVFNGSGFPAEKMDHAFVTESGATYASGIQKRGKKVREFIIDGDGNLVNGPIGFLEYIGTGKASAAAIAAGPDGLYFSDLYPEDPGAGPTAPQANILRVRYTGSNDCNDNGVPDACDIAQLDSMDCNGNGIPDECDIANGTLTDDDRDGLADECTILEADLNGDGCVDQADLGILLSSFMISDAGDTNGDGMTDQADLGILLSSFQAGCK